VSRIARLLVVDDDRDVLEVLEMMLRELGHNVTAPQTPSVRAGGSTGPRTSSPSSTGKLVPTTAWPLLTGCSPRRSHPHGHGVGRYDAAGRRRHIGAAEAVCDGGTGRRLSIAPSRAM
jgi:hypothetical protein